MGSRIEIPVNQTSKSFYVFSYVIQFSSVDTKDTFDNYCDFKTCSEKLIFKYKIWILNISNGFMGIKKAVRVILSDSKMKIIFCIFQNSCCFLFLFHLLSLAGFARQFLKLFSVFVYIFIFYLEIGFAG